MAQRYTRYETTGHGPRPPVDTSVAVVGVGALGTHILENVARQGFTNLSVIDRDIVAEENLSTSALYTVEDVGRPKPVAAAEHLQQVNPDVEVEVQAADLHGQSTSLLENAEVVLDATDNMETRHLLNEYSHENQTPVFFAGCTGTRFFTFPSTPDSGACFACVYPDPDAGVLPSCATHGLLKETAATTASHTTTRLAAFLTDKHQEPQTLLTGDVATGEQEQLRVESDPECRVCHKEEYNYLGEAPDADMLCGEATVQLHLDTLDFETVKTRFHDQANATVTSHTVTIQKEDGTRVAVFSDNRVLVTGVDSVDRARTAAAQYLSQ